MTIWNSLWGQLAATFFISMVPVIELRGAIPIALAHGLEPWLAVLVSVCGNLVPAPFIIVFIRKIFAWLRTKADRLDRLVARLERRAAKKSELVRKYSFWGLFLFVAIPLPGTGAWTGALVAAVLNIRIRRALPPIALGVLAAGLVVAYISLGAGSLLFS